jgi:hypothetical protein
MISKVFSFGSGEEAREQGDEEDEGDEGDEGEKKNNQCPMP